MIWPDLYDPDVWDNPFVLIVYQILFFCQI